MLGAASNDRKIRDRRAALVEKATELGIPNADQRIEVLDANSLARWIEEHPTLAVSPLLGGIDTVATNFAGWAASNRHNTKWVSAASRDDLRTEIATIITGQSQLDLHIEGPSGLGKTRAVLEAFRGTPFESVVLYVNAADDLDPSLIPRLLNHRRAGVVVVDECGAKRHENLAGLLPTGSPVRLISIGEPDTYRTQHPSISLAPLKDEAIDKILAENQPSLWPEARRVIVQASAGNVRWALLLASGVLREAGVSAAELITIDNIRAYITRTLPEGRDFLACSVLALFTRIGYDRELSAELAVVAETLGFSVAELRAAARSLAERGLLTKQGRYRSVAPYPLAVYLASVAWEEFGDTIVRDLLPALDVTMAERLLARAADLGSHDLAQHAVERILGPDGPFASFERIAERDNSKLLVQLVIIAADAASEHLAALIGAASEDELRQQGSRLRRDLVWALEKLAWHTRTFEQAADSLLQLALAETESWSNNATGTWINLFGLRLPATAARPATRASYLASHAHGASAAERQLVVQACSRVFSPHEFVMVSPEVQGGVVVEPRGGPTTYGELWEHMSAAIVILRGLVDDEDATVASAALAALVQAIHPLLEVEPIRQR